jgi:hypothetical protein
MTCCCHFLHLDPLHKLFHLDGGCTADKPLSASCELRSLQLAVPSYWVKTADKSITCSGAEYKGSLGAFLSAAECLAVVIDKSSRSDNGALPNLNYAVWRGDTTSQCYICQLAGDPTTRGMQNDTSAVSYVRFTGAPPPPAPAPPPPPPICISADTKPPPGFTRSIRLGTPIELRPCSTLWNEQLEYRPADGTIRLVSDPNSCVDGAASGPVNRI